MISPSLLNSSRCHSDRCIYSGDNHPPTTSLDPDTYYLIRYCHSSQEQEKIPPVLQLQPPSLVLVSPTDFQMFRYSSPRLPSPKVTLSSWYEWMIFEESLFSFCHTHITNFVTILWHKIKVYLAADMNDIYAKEFSWPTRCINHSKK